MRAAGADLVDVGGESTRPGATRVDAAAECARVLPVITDLVASGVPVSIDTTRAAVAEKAIEAGAVLVNDVSGGLADPAMAAVVSAARLPWVLMHWRGRGRRARRVRGRHRRGAGRARRPRRRRRAGGRRPRADRARPRDRLREGRLPQLDVAAPLGRAGRAGLPGAGGGVAQAVPRAPARRCRGHTAPARRARHRHRGDHRRWPRDRGAWGVRVHDVAASMDAVAVAAIAWHARAEPPGRPALSGRTRRGHDRPDRAARAARARPPRRLRARAPRRAGLRRRRHGVDGPRPGRGVGRPGRHPALRRAGRAGGGDRRGRAVQPDRDRRRARRRE